MVASKPAASQAVPDGFRDKASLWVGADYANFKAGFPYGSNLRLSGIGGFVTYNVTHSIGLEGHFRFLDLNSWYGETEQDYFGGPRYTLLHSNKWRPFASFEIGAVRMNYPFEVGAGNLFALVPGGGLEYRLSHKWSVRAAYEYQILPNSPNFSNEPKFGIRPNGAYAGISYHLF